MDLSLKLGRGPRFNVRKPRLPYSYTPRPPVQELVQGCGNKSIRWGRFPSAQEVEAWRVKNCGPKQVVREFDAGGREAGTLSGARRAAGLFDANWGTPFPLTRREQRALQEGRARYDAPTGRLVETELRPQAFERFRYNAETGQLEEVKPAPAPTEFQGLDAFFAPPTAPAPSNWIEDKLQRVRGTFGPTRFQSPKGYLPFCREGGFVISCVGPDFGAGWYGGSVPLTEAQVEAFKDAYCKPGQCGLERTISPPPGYKQWVQRSKPRNAATALKASCQPVPQPGPFVIDFPLAPPTAAPPPPPPGPITTGCPPGSALCHTTTGIGCLPLSLCMFPATIEEARAVGFPV